MRFVAVGKDRTSDLKYRSVVLTQNNDQRREVESLIAALRERKASRG